VWTVAEIKIGRELAKMPKAKGGLPYQKKSTGSKVGPVEPTLAEFGVPRAPQTRQSAFCVMQCVHDSIVAKKLGDQNLALHHDVVSRGPLDFRRWPMSFSPARRRR
jgi:hypothetical protein